MPFNLSQIFGGWRKKETKGRKSSDVSPRPPRSRLTLPRSSGGSDASHDAGETSQVSGLARAAEKGQSELAWKLIVAPHISEKATMLGEGRYVFNVRSNATKFALKNAIQNRYGVEVKSVNIIQARDKKRRRGAIIGSQHGFKKAVITLQKGQLISEF